MFGTNIDSKGKTDRSSAIRIGKCIFPFKYNGKHHSECLSTPRGKICATSTNNQGSLKKYGYCVNAKKRTKKNSPESRPGLDAFLC